MFWRLLNLSGLCRAGHWEFEQRLRVTVLAEDAVLAQGRAAKHDAQKRLTREQEARQAKRAEAVRAPRRCHDCGASTLRRIYIERRSSTRWLSPLHHWRAWHASWVYDTAQGIRCLQIWCSLWLAGWLALCCMIHICGVCSRRWVTWAMDRWRPP